MNASTDSLDSIISFGPFRVFLAQRQVLEDGRPVRLGNRAFDILRLLIERGGAVVSKEDLLAQVWGGIFVEEANLRVHINGLRRALGDGLHGRRYIVNIPGQGYFFAQTVQADAVQVTPQAAPTADPVPGIPARLTRVIGRRAMIESLRDQVIQRRFITIVGPGGIGKTTVALSVAEQLVPEMLATVAFIDLAPLTDPRQVPNAVAVALGLPVRTEDETEAILDTLRARRMLLIFDSCEHVIDDVSKLAERLHLSAPLLHILATSREPLRVAGEYTHRLEPLAFPPEGFPGTMAELIAFPAVELFLERIEHLAYAVDLTHDVAHRVGEICRRLDGMALAIELSAGRASTYGIEGLASRLHDRFKLLNRGRRTALPRQQTLRATIDWSYDLLPEPEKRILRHCGIFAGAFSYQAAEAVASPDDAAADDFAEGLSSLIDKSLISADLGQDETRYRLLDTMRAYALDRLAELGERQDCASRHAVHFQSELESGLATASSLDNVRAALAWAFSQDGEEPVAVALAATAAPLFLALSLLPECASWAEKALAILPNADLGSRREMELRIGVAMPSLFTQGGSDQVRQGLNRALALATEAGDVPAQARVLEGLFVCHLREADFRGLFDVATQAQGLVARVPHLDLPRADWMLGVAQYFAGAHSEACIHLQRAVRALPRLRRVSDVGVDPRVNANNALCRSLFRQGHIDQALAVADSNIAETETLDHPVSHCIALMWAAPLFLWVGDLARFERHVDELIEDAQKGALSPSRLVGLAFRGVIAARKGDPEAGIELLRTSIQGLVSVNNRLFHVLLLGHLAEALEASNQPEEAIATIDEAMVHAERFGDLVTMPNLLRQRGDCELARHDPTAAQDCYDRALDWARRQGTLTAELQVLMRVAVLQHGTAEARHRLQACYDRFTEGFETADLLAARRLLEDCA